MAAARARVRARRRGDYTAPRSGTDTVTASADLDEDGVRDAGEPQESITVRWKQALPPPATWTTLDGEAMDVRVSSRGAVNAAWRAAGGAQRTLTCDGCAGLVLRFTAGPLDGMTFSNRETYHRPFYGEPQAAPTREGNTLEQLSTYTVRHDEGDEAYDADEPRRVVTVDWRQETAVDPPAFDPLVAPDGTVIQPSLQGSGDQRFVGLTPSQAALFPDCGDGSPLVNLRLHVNVDPGAGRVVPRSMTLRTVDPSTPDLEHPIEALPPVGDAVDGTYTFVLECLREISMYLCYTLEEAGCRRRSSACSSVGSASTTRPAWCTTRAPTTGRSRTAPRPTPRAPPPRSRARRCGSSAATAARSGRCCPGTRSSRPTSTRTSPGPMAGSAGPSRRGRTGSWCPPTATRRRRAAW